MNEKTTVKEVKTEEITEMAEKVTEEIMEKPYTFRKLGAPDMFLMFNIIGKIGISELKTCFETDGIASLIQSALVKEKKENEDANGASMISVGAGVFLELVNTIIGNLPKCEKEIYQLLSNTSNLSVEEISAPGNAVMFFEMLIDFFKKDEFPDFFTVVAKLFK